MAKLTIPYQRNPFLRGIVHADTDNPDVFTLQTQEDIDILQRFCREKQEATRFDQPDGIYHVAEVPVFIYEQAIREGWDTPEGWKRWLNDPANACFRVRKGRV